MAGKQAVRLCGNTVVARGWRRVMPWRCLAAVTALVLLHTAPAGWCDDTADFQQLDDIRRAAGVASMAVVLVQRDGATREFLSGVHDWEGGQPVAEDAIFRIGSVSKMFTGLTLLKAHGQGMIDLDRPLREYIDTGLFDNPWAQHYPLTAAQLMEHTAGWFDMSGAEFDHSDPTPLSLARALAINPASRRSQWPPGRHSEYSNSGAGLAAYALEQASGEDFEALAQRLVLRPLGMHSADYRLSDTVRRHLVQGYDRDGRTPISYWHIVYRPAGGLNLQPRDMAAVIRMLLNRGKVGNRVFLTQAQVQRMEQPATTLAARQGLRHGYGLGIYATQYKGHTLYGHGGDADGYLSHFAYSPAIGKGYFVVIAAFNHRPLNQLKEALNDWITTGRSRPPKPPRPALEKEILMDYVGTYRRGSARFPRPGWRDDRLSVVLRGGKLYTQGAGEGRRELVPVSRYLFRRPWQTTATAAFIPLPEGGWALQGGMGNWERRQAAAARAKAPGGH